MNLVHFYSDKGRGHTQSSVYVNPAEVAAVTDNVDAYSNSENNTVITMKSGQCLYVREYSSAVVAKLAEAEKAT